MLFDFDNGSKGQKGSYSNYKQFNHNLSTTPTIIHILWDKSKKNQVVKEYSAQERPIYQKLKNSQDITKLNLHHIL